jgi:hypothetical protein
VGWSKGIDFLPLFPTQETGWGSAQRVFANNLLDRLARVSRAIGATREALLAAFCRLDKSLSYCWEKG